MWAGAPCFHACALGSWFFREGKKWLFSLLVVGCLSPAPLSRPHPGASWPHPLFSAGTWRKGGRVPAARPQLGRVPRGWTRAGHGARRADSEATAVGQGEEFRPVGKEKQGGVPRAGGSPTEAWHLRTQVLKSGFKSQCTRFLAVWPCASACLSELRFQPGKWESYLPLPTPDHDEKPVSNRLGANGAPIGNCTIN